LEHETSIAAELQKHRYNFIINTGAYTAVDKAESDEERSFTINARALKWIAEHASQDCRIIHISSDYVYNINSDKPLNENDETRPEGIYAISKLLGEELLTALRPESIIIRTSWVYSSFGSNFVKSMIRLAKEKDSLRIVADQIGTPTYARDLAYTIMAIIGKLTDNPDSAFGGIYNFSNSGSTNWADFARKIFELTGIDCQVLETTTADYGAPAHRPAWSVMSKEKIISTFGIKENSWTDSLANCLREIDK
jgi:dTDP-4-dehydrorhamnose reductase